MSDLLNDRIQSDDDRVAAEMPMSNAPREQQPDDAVDRTILPLP